MPIQKLSKEEIIRKCITIFRQKGYYRTNISDLANFCALTKGALYHHFANKEEIMRASLEMTSLWFKKNIFSIAYDAKAADNKKLELLLKMYFKTFTQEKGGCFFANTILETTQVEDTFKDIMLDFFNAWEEALLTIFKSKYTTKTHLHVLFITRKKDYMVVSLELATMRLTEVEGEFPSKVFFDKMKVIGDYAVVNTKSKRDVTNLLISTILPEYKVIINESS